MAQIAKRFICLNAQVFICFNPANRLSLQCQWVALNSAQAVQSDMCSIECLVFLCLSVYNNSNSAFFLWPYPIPVVSICWQPNEIILHHIKSSEKEMLILSLLYRFSFEWYFFIFSTFRCRWLCRWAPNETDIKLMQ